METTFKDYPIFKKRDGQSFKQIDLIYSASFEEAKKEFAQNIANDLQNTCDIVYLTKNDGASEDGFYNLSFGRPIYDEQAEKYDTESLNDSFLVSKNSIDEGFDSWAEDVYTWELREPLEFVEITDIEDFENEKENYSYFMAVEGERFFLYNGDFYKIAEFECLDGYSDTNDKFMGSSIDDVEFIENYLK